MAYSQVPKLTETALGGLCKVCKEPEEKGKRFLICGHSLCMYKYYHIRCLSPEQIASTQQIGEQRKWYCPSGSRGHRPPASHPPAANLQGSQGQQTPTRRSGIREGPWPAVVGLGRPMGNWGAREEKPREASPEGKMRGRSPSGGGVAHRSRRWRTARHSESEGGDGMGDGSLAVSEGR
ncbi:hypothetical protein PVAP13_2NG410403 [Panicum virgatum]|uniref:PHD-type domain-containing protein n=1 Tax=Panicum virgatum TaxID=38727 RepID=A0A8T0VM79_PANVG|nr:hypothetical protein PVAP13_2NG410403 [Panicum virgatum]